MPRRPHEGFRGCRVGNTKGRTCQAESGCSLRGRAMRAWATQTGQARTLLPGLESVVGSKVSKSFLLGSRIRLARQDLGRGSEIFQRRGRDSLRPFVRCGTHSTLKHRTHERAYQHRGKDPKNPTVPKLEVSKIIRRSPAEPTHRCGYVHVRIPESEVSLRRNRFNSEIIPSP